MDVIDILTFFHENVNAFVGIVFVYVAFSIPKIFERFLWIQYYIYQEKTEMSNEYYKVSDGFFNYYVNKETGDKKFKLDKGDIEVERQVDDFIRETDNIRRHRER